MVGDMIVNLYQQRIWVTEPTFNVRKAFISDKTEILASIAEWFPDEKGWVLEAEKAIQNNTLFIATQCGKLVGFMCYDSTAKGYCGPMGVQEDYRGRGIGSQLFFACMDAMKAEGYGYAVIGWVDDSVPKTPVNFYRKVAEVSWIPDSHPERTVYRSKLGMWGRNQ